MTIHRSEVGARQCYEHHRAPNEHPPRSRYPCAIPFAIQIPPPPPKLYHPLTPPTTTRSRTNCSSISPACVSSSPSSTSQSSPCIARTQNPTPTSPTC